MKKKYQHTGAHPIVIDDYGRVEPGFKRFFVCDMPEVQEAFFLKIGAIKIVEEVPATAPDTELRKPSTPPWVGEAVKTEDLTKVPTKSAPVEEKAEELAKVPNEQKTPNEFDAQLKTNTTWVGEGEGLPSAWRAPKK